MLHVKILFGSLQKADINPLTAEKYISSFSHYSGLIIIITLFGNVEYRLNINYEPLKHPLNKLCGVFKFKL